MTYTQATRQTPAFRHWPFDLLRILATYGVVILHLSPLPAEYHGAESMPWCISISLSILFRWCVPAFLMISGALFLSPERPFSISKLYRKTILRILTCFVFWSSFYAIVYCMLSGKGKWTFLNQMLRSHYHMWYIFTILALYMLAPLIRKMTESRRLTEYFLMLGLVFTFAVPRLISFMQLLELPHADVIDSLRSAVAQSNPLPGACSLYYFVLGHYLHTYPPRKMLRSLFIAGGAVGYVLTTLLTIWHTGFTGSSSAQFYDMSSSTVLAMSVGVFLLFEYAFAGYHPGKRMQRVLLTLSECSFGVYLMHPFFIERIEPVLPPEPVTLVLGTLALAFGFSLISLTISFLLHKIPILNRYIV